MTDPIEITIRALGPADEAAVRRLAGRDSTRMPEGRLWGAMMNGELVAARSLSTGERIADPFTRTAEVRALLDEHVSHLNGASRGRDRRSFLRRRSRASLPSSPPGAGGRLVMIGDRAHL